MSFLKGKTTNITKVVRLIVVLKLYSCIEYNNACVKRIWGSLTFSFLISFHFGTWTQMLKIKMLCPIVKLIIKPLMIWVSVINYLNEDSIRLMKSLGSCAFTFTFTTLNSFRTCFAVSTQLL